MPQGFFYLIGAQFFSALADNALLILGIHHLQEQGYPGWWAPLLKFSFTLAYVVLASATGPVSDAFPKTRLMAWMNFTKMIGVLLLLYGTHPVLAFSLVGAAAAIYAPCKYGLVTECIPPHLLVRANAWLEVAIVMSVILGTATGGALVAWSRLQEGLDLGAGSSSISRTVLAFAFVLLLYGLAAVLNNRIHFKNTYPVKVPLTWTALSWNQFWKTHLQLWNDPLGRISLYVTTLYWGVGAVLQFGVLIWAERSLGLTLQHGALLQALVAVGVIVGAVYTGQRYKLHAARRILPAGMVLALLLPLVALTQSLWLAIPLLLAVGATGGMLLVPMNALLQHRGYKVLTAGRSIAVQGFNENFSVLVMLGLYSMLLYAQWSIFSIMALFSLILLVGMTPVWLPIFNRKNVQRK